MNTSFRVSSLVGAVALMFAAGCAAPRQNQTSSVSVGHAIEMVRQKYAPDRHLALFDVRAVPFGETVTLEGEVESNEMKQALLQAISGGPKVVDHIDVMPTEDLGSQTYGIVTLSVATMREDPRPSAELGSQVLMGNVVKLLKKNKHWIYSQSADHYPGWIESDSLVPCTKEVADQWMASPKLIVTTLETRIREQASDSAQPVSDIVEGCLLKKVGETGGFTEVQLPDGRKGYLHSSDLTELDLWKKSRHPAPETIEASAKMLMGTPYLWGGTSTKAVDCSGFTKTVFFLNGIDLLRNASQQYTQGKPIEPGANFENLRKGDLIFFGLKGHDGHVRVRHVGIYLENKMFIHSSGMVHVSSLDPASPIRDEARIRTFVGARRILPETMAQSENHQ